MDMGGIVLAITSRRYLHSYLLSLHYCMTIRMLKAVIKSIYPYIAETIQTPTTTSFLTIPVIHVDRGSSSAKLVESSLTVTATKYIPVSTVHNLVVVNPDDVTRGTAHADNGFGAC